MADVERILIVGGGIAGLTLAAALHQQGFIVELVERNPTWHAAGAGFLVQANGMRVLHALGLGAAIEQAGAVVRRWDFCDEQGEVLCTTDLKALWSDAGPCVGIERTKLQQVLLPGIAVVPCRLGTSIMSLDQDNQRVSATFTDSSACEYDLVVGADGISSAVRRLALSATAPTDLGALNWRSIAPIRPGGLATVQFLLGDGCFFGLCPVGEGRTYGFGYIMQPRSHDPLEGRLERLRNRFAGFGGPVRDYLASLERDEQVHCSAMEWVDVDEWHTGRIVLIGDAAHASSPLMGQGGCMAMEDACVLGETLRSAATVDGALSDYASRRKPRTKWVQSQSIAAAESLRMSPGVRNAALRERGDQMMQSRFGPLIPAP